MGELGYQGHRIRFDVHGEGERTIVLVHGLLMNRRMFDRLGPDLARRGNRVVCVDLLDHLGVERAVIGGTSLGANVGLELAVRHPERVEGLLVEMPVLDNALAAVAAIFSPVLLGLRLGRPAFDVGSRLASLLPRSAFLVDLGLDFARRRPGPSVAVLEGLLLGETAPGRAQRREIRQPALIVGHTGDPLHPFSDSGMLAEELPRARMVRAGSILEWRVKPRRLTEELARFLDEVWAGGERENGHGETGAEAVAR